MKPEDRDNFLYLEDIALSISRILEYVSGMDFDSFMVDHKTVDAVVRNFEIIGEASKNVSKDIKEKYPEVPWDQMYRFRNRISHEYFGIDHSILWEIIEKHLPTNYSQIMIILTENNKGH